MNIYKSDKNYTAAEKWKFITDEKSKLRPIWDEIEKLDLNERWKLMQMLSTKFKDDFDKLTLEERLNFYNTQKIRL